jgi:transcriptional regulator with XRE-family HTH domain
MPRTMVEEFTSTPEGMAEFQQERIILELAILIRRLLKEKGLSKADLAARLGKSKAFVTQILNGRANMTLRTISDVMCALGHSLSLAAGPLEVRATEPGTATITTHLDARSGTVFNSTASQITLVPFPLLHAGTITLPVQSLRIAR